MKKELLNSLLIGILCSTLFFISKEIVGNGLGWLGIAIGFLSAIFFAKKLVHKTRRAQINTVLLIGAACGLFLFSSIWLNERNHTENLALLQGSWQAIDNKSSFLMEVKQDSTYLTASNMPHKIGYVLRLSQDSLILKNAYDNVLALRLLSLNSSVMEVSAGASKLVFHRM